MKKKTPRKYQAEAINTAVNFFFTHNRQGFLLQSPTGSGKTFMASEIIREFTDRGLKVAFFVHSIALFSSTLRDIKGNYTLFEIHASKAGLPTLTEKFYLFTAQTFTRRMPANKDVKNQKKQNWQELVNHFDLLVFDEAHLSYHDQIMIAGKEAGKKLLALTATPKKAPNAKLQLWDIFDVKHPTISYLELIEKKFNMPPYAIVPENIDNSNIALLGVSNREGEAEYNREQASSLMRKKPKIYKNSASIWEKYANEFNAHKTIAFCCDIAHACETAINYNDYGLRVRVDVSEPAQIDEKSTKYDKERYQLWQKSASLGLHADPESPLNLWGSDFDILINVDKYTTGLDVPDIMGVMLLRPILSENLYLQCSGRGNRPCPEIGKDKYLLYDFAGNVERHMLPCADREYIFSPQPKKKKKSSLPPTKECPKCGGISPAMAKICNVPKYTNGQYVGTCGFEFPFERVESEAAFTVLDFQELIKNSENGGILGKALTKKQASVYELYQAYKQHPNIKSPLWLVHKIYEIHGKSGLEKLAIMQGKNVNTFLQWVDKNTQYQVS